MHISGHYSGFPEKTLVVVMNHDHARFFSAEGHELLELPSLHSTTKGSQEDAKITTFFLSIQKRMKKGLDREGFSELWVCVPEIHRPLFQQHLDPTLTKHIKRLIPKNLSAMEEGPIVRILFEG